MADGKTGVHLSLSAKESDWLSELAWRNRLSKAAVLRLLIRQAAKVSGLLDPGELPAANASNGDDSDRADQPGGPTS
jgi:hypothetical protein